MRVLIAGCGYVGGALASLLAAGGHDVLALRRRPGAVAAGVAARAVDLLDEAALRALPGPFDAVVYAAAPDARDERSYRAVYETGVERVLAVVPCERFLLTSSTSVYAQDGGEWVDEGSPAEPREPFARLVLASEALAHALHPGACAVRLGGIYGPGRTRLLRAARAARARPDALRYTNRIHRDDAAGALAHLLARPALAPVYLGVDDEPADSAEVERWLAARVGAAPPPPAPAGAPRVGKRCSNRLLRAAGYRFRFRSFRDGYGALADAERSGGGDA